MMKPQILQTPGDLLWSASFVHEFKTGCLSCFQKNAADFVIAEFLQALGFAKFAVPPA
jgi:hypothetical protein